MILGGITLHAMLGASLFQPVEWHQKRPQPASYAEEGEARFSLLPEYTRHEAEEEVRDEGMENKLPRMVFSRMVALRKRTVQVVESVVKDMKMLRHPTCLIIALGSTLVINAEANFLVMLPFAIQTDGHSLQTAAWCVSIAGVCNLFTRMCVSSLSDLPWFNKRLFYMAGMVVMAVSMLGKWNLNFQVTRDPWMSLFSNDDNLLTSLASVTMLL